MDAIRKASGHLQSYLPSLEFNQEHHRRIYEEIGQQLSFDEVLQHPEFPHVNWALKPESKERIDVAAGRGGPFKISYELHGHGPKKIIWIMGLGGYMKTWQRQTKDFGHTEGDQYSSLVFDNRGIGESDKPLLRYTTFEMARDVVELLDHVGWTEPRSVHIVGISMGGMIAQELALQIPTRICSLNFISTAPRIVRTLPYLENVRNRIDLMWPKALGAQISKVKADCYSAEWLKKPDETESIVQPFPTNGDRFASGELTKRLLPGAFTRQGFLCQLYAAGFHHKSAAQLKPLADAVGRERIMVLHGTGDHMIDFVHGKMLLAELGGEESGVTKSFHDGMGHVAPFEIRQKFKKIIAGRIATTEKMAN
ncbi:hypothetical protein LTR35_017622 [Friedmanniomyces endolithicus]|uniref:AB hydrolase-1 domain-containing protein n=1 Tax=Friedmanniomyces endolithicus TaxID=329885 RepID=A0AAN6FDY6_9PEZI|nr:hypothetical protein LTR35_017622 [Friedmanniomyces endolithicus]KAK0299342.1 hypothetical protein LTS00_001785 [Friedmanniomyces endolithicus]KAK0310972.1 hypothetical protein LTR82_014575 [Friedmanniomyces endolithicus]KAK0983366.1 hypothetical protein LTR54_014326 [Friedmanniomyces endolithicus]